MGMPVSWRSPAHRGSARHAFSTRRPIEPRVGAIHQRIGRLPADVVGYLHTAAVIGRSFDVSLLAAVEGQSTDAMEERMLTAHRAGVVRVEPGGLCAFSHDKIRECLYAQVPPTRVQRL